ncbi:MAG: type II toxin-antitoxin system prevent-host-death family antitoxin [Terriglobia bacterium]|jgi:prevent-host-death family protein
MKMMRAADFKARCSKVLEQVQATRESVIITKRGRPVAKLVPVGRRNDDVFGGLKGVVEIVGDIESPAVPPEEWEANRWFRWRQAVPQPSKYASFPRKRESTSGK